MNYKEFIDNKSMNYKTNFKSQPFDTICLATYDAATTAIGSLKALGYAGINKAKQLDCRACRHLVKPSLTYLSVCCLAASAAMYYSESISKVQNISNDFPNNPKILKVDKDLYVVPSEELQNVYLDKTKLSKNLYSEFWCLKLIGWNEIRNGSEHAMKAVYSVVENRKKSKTYPDTYCEIMKQSKQFSFWNQGKYNVKSLEPKPVNDIEVQALKKIEELSLKVVTGTFNPVLPRNVMWYSTPAAKASKGSKHWTQQYRVATQAGPHLFYTKPSQSI